MTVAIVGGGISGLALAEALLRQGVEVVAFEADERPGGVMRSFHLDGFVTEAGPNTVLDREPALRELLERLQLLPRWRTAAPESARRYLFTRGKLREVPASPAALLRAGLLPPLSLLRALAEPLTGRGAAEDESLARFFRRHVGEVATATLVDALQTGIYAGDPEKLSLPATFPKVAELERTHRSLLLGLLRGALKSRREGQGERKSAPTLGTLEGGLGELPRALAERLGGALHTQARVEALRKTGTGWQLSVREKGRLQAVEAGQVVLALPSYLAAKLVDSVQPALAAELEAIPYAPVAVVHLGFRRAQLPSMPPGFGFLVPAAEGRRVLGVLFSSSMFPWRAREGHVLLTCMLGGARRPELVHQDDPRLLEAATAEVADILGARGGPVFTQIVRWQRGIPQYNVGHLARLARIDVALGQLPGLHLAGNSYRGVAVGDCVRDAGSLATRLAAEGR